MILPIPELSLVVLIGPSGSGKSTFASRHFRPTEVLSSDAMRAWISDDENDQSATQDAFDVLHRIAAKRLARGRLTVIDATSVKPDARKPLLDLARRYSVRPVALVFHLPEEVCQERNRHRPDRQVEPFVVSGQIDELRRSLPGLAREGFQRNLWIFRSRGDVDAVRIERQPVSVPSRRPYAGTARQSFSQGSSIPDPPPAPALPEPSRRPDFLEHPDEVFASFRAAGVRQAVCEEMLGGTRAVVMICRDEEEARRRLGGEAAGGMGAAWTTSRGRLIEAPALEKAFLGRLRDILDRAELWERLGTGWVSLEGELTPWSLSHRDLRERYTLIGAAARAALPKAVARLAEAGARGLDVHDLLARQRERYELSVRFAEAYRRRCRRVASVADLRFAPFHILATEKNVQAGKDRLWHLEMLAEVCRAGPELLIALPFRLVDLEDPASEAEATRWWAESPEGMVVKPLIFDRSRPAMLCRGREALRLVYGPEYTLPDNLERLRARLREERSAAPC